MKMHRLNEFIKGKLAGNAACGIHCEIRPDGQLEFSFVLLKREKNSIRIISTGLPGPIENITAGIPAGTPVYLSVSGKGTIQKTVDQSMKDNHSVSDLFPQLKPEDLFIQKIEATGNRLILSFCRKEKINEIKEMLAVSKRQLVSITIGPFDIINLLPLLEINPAFETEIQCGRYSVTTMNGGLTGLKNIDVLSEDKIQIGDESVDNRLLIPFSSALLHFNRSVPEFNSDPVATERAEYYYRKLFGFSSALIAGFFLVSFLVNYLAFFHYSSRLNILSEKAGIDKEMLVRYDSLKVQVERRKKFLTGMGLLGADKISWYTDEISYEIPANIRLSLLSVNPVIKQNNGSDEFDFDQKKILVSGFCSEAAILDTWIKQLQDKKWISEVELLSFSQDKLKSEGKFTIKISLIA